MPFALFVLLVAGLHTRLKQSGARHRREPLRQRAAKMEMFSSEAGGGGDSSVVRAPDS